MTGKALALVDGRTCGACTHCCQQLLIDAPELTSLPGILCTHCVPGAGCQIHTMRPDVCRSWFCGWRYLADLNESWRPDRSGLLIEFTEDDIPDGFTRQVGLKVTVLKAPVRLKSPKVIALLCGFVLQSIPVFLATKAEPGKTSGKALLNNRLAEPATARDKPAARRAIWEVYETAARVPTRTVNLS